MQSRTHTCGELRSHHAGQEVTLAGWYENLRLVGKHLGFLILRDFYGTTQIVLDTEELLKQVQQINKESTLLVTGIVQKRSSRNPALPTGEIEVCPSRIEITSKCQYQELPFEINHSRESDENTRLKYRYLDLRNPSVKQNMVLRSQVIFELRQRMTQQDFLEITTPILTASSPEGARDYLVPSRKFPGEFYALPQAPQQFKQLLMTSGFDRYFQIAPCFRDEDARADRSPGEFYQLDMEMAFASQEDVFSVIETVLPPVFEKYGKYRSVKKEHFPRIIYKDSMEFYGTDKPDLRLPWTIQDVTKLLETCGFAPFDKQRIKAIVVHDFQESRKWIDRLSQEVQQLTGKTMYWFRVQEEGTLIGGISKYLSSLSPMLLEKLSLRPKDFVCILAAPKLLEAQKAAGVLLKMLGNFLPSYMEKEQYQFCWIVDFPMYEISEETGKLTFCHNPFSMPKGGMQALEAENPLDITAYQYDLVCNGIELSSGAVRNHDPELMVKAFQVVGLEEKHVKEKFPALYHAFCYGAPPHAGIAPGIDRMLMLLSGENSIREVIPFPMNSKAQDLLCNAPSTVEPQQLLDVHIQTITE